MKLLKFGLTMSLAVVANDMNAEETVTFEGQVYPLSILTDSCNSQAEDPQAMIACFNKLSDLIAEQSGEVQETETPVAATQDAATAEQAAKETAALQAAAQQAAAQQAAAEEAAAQLAAAQEAAAQAIAARQAAEQETAALLAAAQQAAAQEAAALAAAAQEAAALEAERQRSLVPVPEALAALQVVASFQNGDSGLSITGTDCNIQITYFGNYYHLSRRNVSTIDLFSAQFDASQLQYDQISEVAGAQVPLSRGLMMDGATATSLGGIALDSSQDNFEPMSPRLTIDAYANEVTNQLPAREDQAFDFVLVHPAQKQASSAIWDAFETFVNACKA